MSFPSMASTKFKDALSRIAGVQAGDVFSHPELKFKLVVVESVGLAGSFPTIRINDRAYGNGTIYAGKETSQTLYWGKWELSDIGYQLISKGFRPHSARLHYMIRTKTGVVYVAGCRRFTSLKEALAHWDKRRRRCKEDEEIDWKRTAVTEAFAEATELGWIKSVKKKKHQLGLTKNKRRPR